MAASALPPPPCRRLPLTALPPPAADNLPTPRPMQTPRLQTNRRGVFFLTRPNTGLSPFEEDEYDLRRKYERVAPEQARPPWEKACSSSAHEDAAGRLSHVQASSTLASTGLPFTDSLCIPCSRTCADLTSPR